jgi:hypothetical protein
MSNWMGLTILAAGVAMILGAPSGRQGRQR